MWPSAPVRWLLAKGRSNDGTRRQRAGTDYGKRPFGLTADQTLWAVRTIATLLQVSKVKWNHTNIREWGLMNGMMKNARLLLIAAVACGTAGCALTRAELDLPAKRLANPASGPAVHITAVKDMRKFEKDPDEPSTPSLKGGEIDDKSITSRAFARKRNAYGKALGDILLPPGRTVANVVEETVTRAFQERGYRVVGTDIDAKATPVEVDINQFWAWFTPGFWAVTVEFKSSLDVRVPISEFDSSALVQGTSQISCQIANEDAWVEVMTKGLDDLVANLKARIPSPPSP